MPSCSSGKAGFASVKAARKAHRWAGWRLRVYACRECGLKHVANAEKALRRAERQERRA
jgi:hypothetical protein